MNELFDLLESVMISVTTSELGVFLLSLGFSAFVLVGFLNFIGGFRK